MYGVVCTRRVLERVDLISRTLCVLDSDKAYLWQVRSGILGRVPVTDEIRLGVTSRAPPSRGLPVPIIGTDPAAGDREHRVDASSQVILRLVDRSTTRSSRRCCRRRPNPSAGSAGCLVSSGTLRTKSTVVV